MRKNDRTFRLTAQKSIIKLVEEATKNSSVDDIKIFQGSKNYDIPEIAVSTSALRNVININQLGVSEEELGGWLVKSQDDVRSKKDKEINDTLVKELLKNEGLKNLAKNVKEPKAIGNIMANQVCTITVSNKENERVLETGTGVFLTDTLILTCRHVLGNKPLNKIRVRVNVPMFHGLNPFTKSNVAGWSAIRLDVISTESMGPVLHVESPALPKELRALTDWGKTPSMDQQYLDFCILEIDKNTKEWEIGIVGKRSVLMNSNYQFLLNSISNQFPKNLKKPVAHYEASELNGQTVIVHTLSPFLKLDSVAGGSVKSYNNKIHRIRYGTGEFVDAGDSGSPITNLEGELIALHSAEVETAQGEIVSQAIPVGPIFDHIKSNAPNIYKLL